ncbi:hypothetical protein LZ31DRAFT_592811 [Colletotrichum somersetense]|nr:hypothetical protein LZ31DRAFT_592811 [Colletotrichum somersetense]
MEPAQHTEGPMPSAGNSNISTLRNSQQESRSKSRSQSSKPRRKPRSSTSDTKGKSMLDGLDREHESDAGEDTRDLGPKNSNSTQSGSRPARRRPSAPRAAPASAPPAGDEHLVDPVPLRPGVPARRTAPTRLPQLGESSASSLASDTDTTSSSSSSSLRPLRRPPVRRRTSKDISLRGPLRGVPEFGEVPPGGPDFSTPLPQRTKNPRDILNDGERGFIVDLRVNLEVDIQIKAKLMGDLTLSVL